MSNNIKLNLLILTGKSVYVVGTLAVIGAGAVVHGAGKAVCKIKSNINDKKSKKKGEA